MPYAPSEATGINQPNQPMFKLNDLKVSLKLNSYKYDKPSRYYELLFTGSTMGPRGRMPRIL
jgi:hypothetical protein